jgi:UDP-3-O-acyl-N-acetylglucosamine deacetylase
MALHLGRCTSCKLIRIDGPLAIEQSEVLCPLDRLEMKRADRGVTVTDPSGQLHLDLVEHLLSALGGLGIQSGLLIQTEDPELPLLDGGALRWAEMLNELQLESGQPRARICGSGTIEVGSSIYEFEEAPDYDYRVSIDIVHSQIQEKEAQWGGARDDFLKRIASARTFGFMSEAQALRATSRARGANFRDVIVLCDDGSSVSEPKPTKDECARHKLLDLIGDLKLWAALPIGKIHAHRPGHRSSFEAARRAISQGLVQRIA